MSSVSKLVFRVHAVQRMFQRDVSVEDVRRVLRDGEEIERYPSDQPYPSRLVLGWSGRRALHVLVAENIIDDESIIITVYEPDRRHWDPGLRRRR